MCESEWMGVEMSLLIFGKYRGSVCYMLSRPTLFLWRKFRLKFVFTVQLGLEISERHFFKDHFYVTYTKKTPTCVTQPFLKTFESKVLSKNGYYIPFIVYLESFNRKTLSLHSTYKERWNCRKVKNCSNIKVFKSLWYHQQLLQSFTLLKGSYYFQLQSFAYMPAHL